MVLGGVTLLDFPDGSAGKESSCNAGDTKDVGSIPGPGRGCGNPHQYCCLEEEGMATHSSIVAWRIPWTEGPGGLQSVEVTKRQT